MAKKKIITDPKHYLKIAEGHLERVQDAWDPPDWADLGTYGLYCLEALTRAATLKDGKVPERTHWGKAAQAKELAAAHGVPDIEDLMTELNDLRKTQAYGEETFDESEHDAEDISNQINEYYDAIVEFCK